MGRSIRIFCHVSSFVCNIWVFCNVMIIRRRPYRCACKGASEGSISLIYIEYAASIPPAHQYLTLIGSAPWSEISWTEMEGSDFMAKFDQLSLQKGWFKKEAKLYRTHAIKDDIISNSGVDLSILEQWQKLCSDVGIEPTARSITQCKKVSFHAQFSSLNLLTLQPRL